jgi:ribosome modulation factor
MNEGDKKVCKIDDARLVNYVNRTRSGREQVFYTGNDNRDFERYKAEGGHKTGAEMHDKPDTIRIQPPEKHYYAELIDGTWWWVNGCAECNGMPRDWMTYIECEKHNVCRTCGCDRSSLTEPPWGGRNGWQCKSCATIEHEADKRDALEKVANKEYDDWDFHGRDEITCPYCEYEFSDSWECSEHSDEDQECPRCDNVFKVTAVHSLSFDCSRIE